MALHLLDAIESESEETLAVGLAQGDSHTAWEETTIADLLGGFRGVTSDDVRMLAADAGVTADAEFATCDPDEVVRLATSLRRASPSAR